jgi:hypothetical protein
MPFGRRRPRVPEIPTPFSDTPRVCVGQYLALVVASSTGRESSQLGFWAGSVSPVGTDPAQKVGWDDARPDTGPGNRRHQPTEGSQGSAEGRARICPDSTGSRALATGHRWRAPTEGSQGSAVGRPEGKALTARSAGAATMDQGSPPGLPWLLSGSAPRGSRGRKCELSGPRSAPRRHSSSTRPPRGRTER